ncbi:hypothetical protein BDY19DRAFT_1002556 [Irpex rosettiformis]|uniref:Uncharacterized protein n=1 Tax=Irpex rosettiformis TaxID=378272 RepID=A0ACB8ULX5_9APHY|nr:hypothetical protein BDY19DRAFT_1002556 [Irpex rosettiformis]
METFLHCGVIEVVKTDSQRTETRVISLLQQLGSTHLATDSQDVILSLCESYDLVQNEQTLRVRRGLGRSQPTTRGTTHTPGKPIILYQRPDFSIDLSSILERITKGKALDNLGTSVTNIGEGLLVKYSLGVRITEVHNALCARSHTSASIPISDIHMSFRYGDVVYIVTDPIHGSISLGRWGTLIAQLRSLRGSVPGPVDGSRFGGPWFTFH